MKKRNLVAATLLLALTLAGCAARQAPATESQAPAAAQAPKDIVDTAVEAGQFETLAAAPPNACSPSGGRRTRMYHLDKPEVLLVRAQPEEGPGHALVRVMRTPEVSSVPRTIL